MDSKPAILAVAHAFPEHYYPQEAMLEALRRHWAHGHANLGRLERIHHNVGVKGRHLALPIQEYEGLQGFGAKNKAWIRSALDLGETVLCSLFDKAEIEPRHVSQRLFEKLGLGLCQAFGHQMDHRDPDPRFAGFAKGFVILGETS